jgi:hypothetical protein
MTEPPIRGAFPHQHQDPRGLRERIDAQLRDRIEEAVEMVALRFMVEGRARDGRPAPETTSAADRREFEHTALAVLAHLHAAFEAELGAEHRAALAAADSAPAGRARHVAAQAWLARRLPDYWQRFERHAGAFPGAAPPGPAGWLRRLLAGGPFGPSSG